MYCWSYWIVILYNPLTPESLTVNDVSVHYNRTGWLGVKHQFTYIAVNMYTIFCFTFRVVGQHYCFSPQELHPSNCKRWQACKVPGSVSGIGQHGAWGRWLWLHGQKLSRSNNSVAESPMVIGEENLNVMLDWVRVNECGMTSVRGSENLIVELVIKICVFSLNWSMSFFQHNTQMYIYILFAGTHKVAKHRTTFSPKPLLTLKPKNLVNCK